MGLRAIAAWLPKAVTGNAGCIIDLDQIHRFADRR
jgi:hypothetical protein